MCNGSSINKNGKFTLRSSSVLTATDQALLDFKNSSDYKNYLKNFKTTPQFDFATLLTYNHATVQAICIPVIQSSKEYSTLIYYYDFLTNKSYTIFLQTTGNLDNLLDAFGTLNICTVSKGVLFNGDFEKSQLTKITPTQTGGLAPVDYLMSGCISNSLSSMFANDISAVICTLQPEECLAAVAIHCFMLML